MTTYNWETINTPTNDNLAPFYKWGEREGQQLVGTVTNFTADGGRDYDGNPCPRIDIELTEETHNLRDGAWEKLEAGTPVTWQGNSPARLARDIVTANPKPGDLIKLRHEGTYKTVKGTGKAITVQIARGAGTITPQPAKQPISARPPF